MKKIYLIILDGFGIAPSSKSNAVTLANTPYLDKILAEKNIAKLKTHGHSVGLPEFQTGGSEVGHITIGAGRPVKHILTKINDEIENGTFFAKENLKNLFTKAQKNSRIHFVGMASDGGIHSFLPHLFGLGKMAQTFGIKDVFVHSFLDGRDVPERTAKNYLKEIEDKKVGKIATIGGRFFAMDRDNNWERTEEEYQVLTNSQTKETTKNWQNLIDDFYKNGNESDYYFPPKLLDKNGQIRENDVVICFNFRTDRMRQIMQAFCDKKFDKFSRKFFCDAQNFGVFGNYYDTANIIFSLSKEKIKNTLGEIIAKNNQKQLRIAETDKVNHVTFFFSGEQKELFAGEERILVNSPKVPSYADSPEMSAKEHTEKAIKKIKETDFQLVVHNYANGDLVGHSANIPATITAVETLDKSLAKLLPIVFAKNYTVIITADHGNCEEMMQPDGKTPNPSHSQNLVPLVVMDSETEFEKLKEFGELSDVAPTILEILELKKPIEMTGESLLG